MATWLPGVQSRWVWNVKEQVDIEITHLLQYFGCRLFKNCSQTLLKKSHTGINGMNSVRFFCQQVCVRLVQSTCWHLTWFLWTVTPSVTVCKSPGACESRCGPSSVSSDRSLCQMSQNNCYDSQGHWENSSAAGLSAQMSPAVTPGGPPDPPWNNSLLQ